MIKRRYSDSVLDDYQIVNRKKCKYECDECQYNDYKDDNQILGSKCYDCDKLILNKGICNKCYQWCENHDSLESIFTLCMLFTTTMFFVMCFFMPFHGTIYLYNLLGINEVKYGWIIPVEYIVIIYNINTLMDYASWTNTKIFHLVRYPFTSHITNDEVIYEYGIGIFHE
jgi:hypothetical protein